MDLYIPSVGSRLVRLSQGALVTASVWFLLASNALAQQPTCVFTSNAVTVHAEGLAEPMGSIVATCSGGTVGSTASLTLFVSLNANISNRLDANSLPMGISIAGASTGSFSLTSATTLVFNAVNYTITAAPSTLTISGIRAAVAPLVNGNSPAIVTATVEGIGAQFPPAGLLLQIGISAPTLLSSLVNNGVPCNGSPLPATLDFPTFAATSVSSELRITEASASAFSAKTAGADTGVRIQVSLTGYGTGARVFVPDAIVGNSGTTPTAAGAFYSSVNGGAYTPGGNGQLLLIRVAGADATGAGGTLALSKPTVFTSYTSVTEVILSNGAALVTYEVVDANAVVQESAHIPVFVVVAQTNCPTSLAPNLTAAVAPVSHVATATMTDPIPRFAPAVPALDCSVLSDCSSFYFPNLSVATAQIGLSGSSLGGPQSAFVAVGNTGSGILNFTTSIAYPSGTATGWLSVSPSSGANNVTLQLTANPMTLQPGTYTATVTVSAAPYGTGVVPVTFNVGPVGVTVQNMGNAASFVYGTVAPGSYAVLYGLNLVSGTAVPMVTFNGVVAQVVYSSATQINLIVPATLAGQQSATVVVTAGGLVSNSFKVNLALNAPGIFNPGIVNFADGSTNGPAHPAARGNYVSIYLTGLSNPVSNVTVNLGGQTGIVPQFAGAQPTLPALDQVNVLVPASLSATPNPIPVQVCVPGSTGQLTCSNQVNLYIQ
jgi:uncharacterized protein (TIGR03437 family)